MKRFSKQAGKVLAIATAFLLVFSVYNAHAQRSRGGGSRGGGMGGFHGGSSGGFRGGSSTGIRSGGFNRGPSVSASVRTRGGFTTGYRPTPRYYGGTRIVGRYGYHRPYYGYYRHYGYGNYYNYYAPYLGLSFGFLPWGYSSLYYGPNLFYYNNGLFYRQYDDGDYHVVEPPVGAEVNKLPRKATQVTIDGQQYFEKDGVYYQQETKENGKVMYKVTGKDGNLDTGSGENGMPLVGDVVDDLPDNTRIVTLNGQKYFVSEEDVYYQELNDSGKPQYKVVRTSDSEDQNNGDKQTDENNNK